MVDSTIGELLEMLKAERAENKRLQDLIFSYTGFSDKIVEVPEVQSDDPIQSKHKDWNRVRRNLEFKYRKPGVAEFPSAELSRAVENAEAEIMNFQDVS
jgi:hypothetical protein